MSTSMSPIYDFHFACLRQGYALARMKDERLYLAAGFNSFAAYLQSLRETGVMQDSDDAIELIMQVGRAFRPLLEPFHQPPLANAWRLEELPADARARILPLCLLEQRKIILAAQAPEFVARQMMDHGHVRAHGKTFSLSALASMPIEHFTRLIQNAEDS
jgi:hypothetical protein